MSDGGDSEPIGVPRQPRCSICGKAASERYRPFCSKRCANIDLARWLGDGYVIAGGDTDSDEDGDQPSGGIPGKDNNDAHK